MDSSKHLDNGTSSFIKSNKIFLVLYVDDVLLASNDIRLLHETKRFLAKNFEMKDHGKASYVLGIEIHWDCSRGILGLSEKNYIKKVLKRYGMQDCKPGDTPVTKEYLLHETKRFLAKNFEMKHLGKASYMLGIEIHLDRSRGILGLSQKNYIKKVLKRYGMQDCKLGDTSMTKGDKFSLKQCPKNNFEEKEM
ncbi:UNVERIFIED_CONTAM: Copia protein [Sesamum angustifolium]|uniref:Copia protein n=1 Tax=Sesamum angustifolium TaxID=2727405 RepID=A0AAW2LY92_9LAMI